MTTKYIAALVHHSISSARTVTVVGTLDQAIDRAWEEYKDELRDACIVITDDHGEVATRRIGDSRWRKAA